MATSPDPLFNEQMWMKQQEEENSLYTLWLPHAPTIIQPQADVALRQQTYRAFRAAVQHFISVCEQMDKAVGREAARRIFPALDYWYGSPNKTDKLHLLLASSCDSCGLPLLSEDLLGQERYEIGPFIQACSACADLAFVGSRQPLRRTARIESFARAQPDRLAGIIVAGMRRRKLVLHDIEEDLGIDQLRTLQLILSSRDIIGEFELGIAVLAAGLPCRKEPLRSLLADGLQELGGSTRNSSESTDEQADQS